MGIFDYLKKALNPTIPDKRFNSKTEKEMYMNNPKYRDLKDKLDYHNDLYKRIGAILDKYSDGHDDDAYISELESIISTDHESEAHVWDRLLNLYINKKQYNKAWSFTNKLILNDKVPKEKIRHEQVRILKKEKKYLPATDILMAEYLLKSEWNNTFKKDAFIKDAGICTRALKWDNSMLDEMADLVATQVKKKNYDEGKLHDIYKRYLQSKGIMSDEV
jgi:hypothetical protein